MYNKREVINERKEYMRDANRIPIVLKKLEELWRLYPDMRFGQLAMMLISMMDTSTKYRPSGFNAEDDLWGKLLDEEIEFGKSNKE